MDTELDLSPGEAVLDVFRMDFKPHLFLVGLAGLMFFLGLVVRPGWYLLLLVLVAVLSIWGERRARYPRPILVVTVTNLRIARRYANSRTEVRRSELVKMYRVETESFERIKFVLVGGDVVTWDALAGEYEFLSKYVRVDE